MTWVKLDDGFADHPKLLALSDRAFRLHVRGLCYCGRYTTDGRIPEVGFLASSDAKALVELVARGVWFEQRDGEYAWAIHDFLQYNPSKASDEERRAKKRAAGSAGGQATARARAAADATAGAASNGAAGATALATAAGDAVGSTPVPGPVPDPSPEPLKATAAASAAETDPFDAGKWEHLLASLIEHHGWPENGRGAVTWKYLMALRIEYGSGVVDSALSDVSLDEVPPLTTAAGYLRSVCERFSAAVSA